MPTPALHLSTPHPTSTKYIRSGIGGAGNYRRAPPAPESTPAPAATRSTATPKAFISGRGGAGNVHDFSERAIFSFDEELERLTRAQDSVAPVYHVGRGGAGNMVHDRRESFSSGASAASGDGNGKARRSVEWVRERLTRRSVDSEASAGSGRS